MIVTGALVRNVLPFPAAAIENLVVRQGMSLALAGITLGVGEAWCLASHTGVLSGQ
jgi:hypothetical protein